MSVDDFVLAQAETYQAIVERFREEQIEIPGPRQSVRLIDKSS